MRSRWANLLVCWMGTTFPHLAGAEETQPLLAMKRGESIAFVSNIDGQSRIGLLSADGSRSDLIRRPGRVFWPSWSPDGARLAYVERDQSGSTLRVASADGTADRLLASQIDGSYRPAWSPDGTRIAFAVAEARNPNARGFALQHYRISIVDIESREVATLDGMHGAPLDWCPVGNAIAYVATEEMGSPDALRQSIRLVTPDGDEIRSVVAVSGQIMQLSWSPDGQRLAFASNCDFDPQSTKIVQIHVVDADGTHLRRLTNLNGQCVWPVWSGDGTRIVYHANINDAGARFGTLPAKLFVMSADGLIQQQLTSGDRDEYAPAFRPVVELP